jgi:outer membrane murein-binding lipoprotein Lpp
MKILQTKLSNVTAYLLLVFAVASSALFLYGQFSNLTYETINSTASELDSVVNSIELEGTVEDPEEFPAYDEISTPDMESDMMSSETPAVE